MKLFLSLIGALAAFIVYAEDGLLSDLLIGKYLLIGKSPDSDNTYSGKVEIYGGTDKLKVIRQIGNLTVHGEATIETVLNGDAKVLRVRFSENTIEYEETCLVHSDLDNNPRISCYLYQPGVKTEMPGIEALFHDHTEVDVE